MVERLKRVRVARWVMLFLFVVTWVNATAKCMGDDIAAEWALGRYVDLAPLLATPAWLALGAAYLAAALAFTFSVRERLTGGFLFLALGLIGSAEMCVRDNYMPSLDILLAGNMALAWVLGLSSGGSPREAAERGHDWMCGVFGAMLTLSGLSKLSSAGTDWLDGGMHSLFIWERAQPAVNLPLLRELRLFLADTPALCSAGAAFTLTVECLGIAFAFTRLRRIYAFAVTAMFLGMDVVLGFGEPGWLQLPLALAFSSLAPREA